jgi:heterodisulfide reductase subunit D
MKRLERDQLSLRQLLNIEACSRCAECVRACPVQAATSESDSTAMAKIALWKRALGRDLSPGPSPTAGRGVGAHSSAPVSPFPRFGKGAGGVRSLFGRILRPAPPPGEGELVDAAFDCTLCGRCQAVCPLFLRTHDLWIAQRRQLARALIEPEAIARLAARLRQDGNIAGRPQAERLSWLGNMPEPPAVPDRAEVAVFVGCVGSLYPQAFALPQSLVTLLHLVGPPVALLGQREVCCGFPLYISGLEEEALSLARRNLEALKATGARTVVTPCPSCYHTLSVHYPLWLGAAWDVRVLNGAEYLDEMLAALLPRLKPLPLRVTYHDPCDLGRLSGIYELPRRLLRRIPGLELVEMEENREQALCCGGGGDVEMLKPELSQAIAGLRLKQAAATGAEAIATACPQCKRALTAAARRARSALRTYDVAELLLRSVMSDA